MREYLYKLELIERLWDENAWTEKDENIVGEHFKRLVALKDKGIVLLAGKTDKDGDDGFGLVIFKAESDESAEKIMNDDPAIKQGIMMGTLFPYRVAVEGFSGKGER